MFNLTRKTLIIILIIILIVGGLLYWALFNTYVELPYSEDLLKTQATGTTTDAAQASKTSTSKKTTKTNTTVLTYAEALNIYKGSGYFFQFVNCHGSPGSLTMKVGTKFMIDNRDSVARTIVIQGATSYKVPAYNFTIAIAPQNPGLYYITCNGGGAARITVQP